MRDTITLNGIESSTITGLLIQKLPAITKPEMRTNIEEIDGRDGDIVTELGYKAYDRDVSIGLYGAFDIDAVIKYFTGSGKAVFSNEPNKVYDYAIYKNIDYEKLIRFRTATVCFHVQPYKHLLGETPIMSTDGTISAFNSGNTVACPRLTVTGSGDISVYLAGTQIFDIALGDEGSITIDGEKMNAYKDGVYKNRLVKGEYDTFVLQPGTTEIKVSGTVTNLQLENYSRWI